MDNNSEFDLGFPTSTYALRAQTKEWLLAFIDADGGQTPKEDHLHVIREEDEFLCEILCHRHQLN